MKKVLFLFTVDTEEEWDWRGPFPKPPFSVQNVKYIPKFQSFCQSAGIKPTYFVNYAIAEDDEASALLRSYLDAKECDVGAHLHPWCNPPVSEEINPHNSYILNLPGNLVEEKLNNLVDLLQKRFGTHPFSFRSGRWGMNGPILSLLAKAGFAVDTSIRAFYSDTYFSYYNVPNIPYWPDLSDPQNIGNQRQILEIPATGGFNRPWFTPMGWLYNQLAKKPYRYFRLIGILWRLGIMRKISITPEGYSAADLISCIDSCVKCGVETITLFFHSSNLLPGNTPYVQSPHDEEKFYLTMNQVVDHIKTHYDVRFCSVRDAYDMLVKEKRYL